MAARPYDRTPGPRGIPEDLPDHAGRGLPGGVELYHLGPDGSIVLADREGSRELGPERDFLRFIDDGQFAHYLVGDAGTSPERPSNATVKLGVVGPRSAFTPHAHGGEHFVLSLGHAACGLYDPDRGRVAEVPLVPGMLIRIPEMMPHSFANRGDTPLTILAANTGYGIDHEDYAITAAEAEHRAALSAGRPGRAGPRTAPRGLPEGAAPRAATAAAIAAGTASYYRDLAAALRDIERAQQDHGVAGTTVRERLAAWLRRAATALEVPPVICPHCERNLLRKERRGNICSNCKRRYALDPKTNPLRLNDLRVRRITAVLTDGGRIEITPGQLWYALARKRIKEGEFAPGCAGGGFFGAGLVCLWAVLGGLPFLLFFSGVLLATGLGILIARQLGAGRGIPPMTRGAFRTQALAEWLRVYGSLPPGVVDDTGHPWPPWPADAAPPNAVLICPDPSIAAFLTADGLPGRHGIALVPSPGHLPALLPALPPHGPVLLLHDADAYGALLLRELRASLPGRPVLPAGPPLRTLRGLPNAVACRDPAHKPTAADLARLTGLGEFTEDELKWLAQGWRYPLVGVPPVRLLTALDRLAERAGRIVDAERRHAAEVGFMTWPGAAAAGDGPHPAGGVR